MNLADVVNTLDSYFAVKKFDESGQWLSHMDDVHRAAAKPFFVPEFWDGAWNGLMLNNGTEADRVYLVVFPTSDAIDTIIAREVERGASGSVIFAHHPAAYEEAGRGFVQIPIEQLEELREHQISYYNCHSPLDCHAETSTGTALANALGLHDLERFAKYYGGYAGVYGTVAQTTFQKFAEHVAKVCELTFLRYDQIVHNTQPIQKVALVPGSGGSPEFINEAAGVGADTFVTGHWHLFGNNDYSRQRREEFATYIPTVKINLIGASHYSSEMVVMRDQMKAWFREELELEAVFIPQDDPWGQ